MLIYLCVQTRFLYLVGKYFFSIFKKAGFNMALKVRSDYSPFLSIAYYVLRFSFTFSLRNFYFVSDLR